MPRHAKKYDDDIEDARGGDGYYEDDGYDERQHPSSKKAKEITGKKKKESNRYIEEPMDIPRPMHGALIGPKGAKLRELEEEFKCSLDIPKKEENSDTIYICGGESDVRAAKAQLAEMVKEYELTQVRRNQRGDLTETSQTQKMLPALPGEEKCVLQVQVEKFAHGKVIGTGAVRLHDLKKRLTKQDTQCFDMRGVDVVVPLKDDVSDIISINMPRSLTAKAEKVVQEFFEFYDIKEHLLGVTVVDVSMSMQGDTSAKVKSKKQKASGGKGDAAPAAAPRAQAGSTAAATQPSAPAASAASKAPAGKDKKAAGGGAAARETAAAHIKNVRQPRPAVGTLTDLVATNGYTHRILTRRQQYE